MILSVDVLPEVAEMCVCVNSITVPEYKEYSFLRKMFFVVVATSLVRPKYYIAWKLSKTCHLVLSIYIYMSAVWCSGNALVSINAVALHRARLVLGWVTAFGQVN